MNGARKALVKKAFTKIDRNGNGIVEVDDLKGVYNAKNHPDVKLGKKTEEEVLSDFWTLSNSTIAYLILAAKIKGLP